MMYLRDIPSWRFSWSTRETESRYQVGRDGRTAYELHAGEPYRRQLVEFGERVYFMPIRLRGAKQAKMVPKLQDEAFIGIRDRSDEMLIMTPSGVYKTRNVRRPWNPNPAAGEMAADALPAQMAVPMPAPAPGPQVVVATSSVDRAASRVVHQENRCAGKMVTA